MKLLCLVTLLVCAFVRAANVDYESLPLVEDVEKHLEDLHLELDLLSTDHAVTEDDKLLISELQTLEAQGRGVVTDAIEDMIEDFRDVVIHGNDDLPPLDPLDIPIIGPFEHQFPSTKVTATINEFKMEGLRWYVLDKITFNAVRLSFAAHITIPWITVTGTYDAAARMGFLNHNAGGRFRSAQICVVLPSKDHHGHNLHGSQWQDLIGTDCMDFKRDDDLVFIHRIEVGLDMRLGTSLFGGHLLLRELNIKIDIHDTHIQIHGMTGSNILNALINNHVQSLTQEAIQSNMENVSKVISEELFDVVNDVLKEFTISDIFST